MITQEQLKEILHYDPETGVFSWAINRGFKMKVGDKAGTINKKGYVMIYYKKKCYISHRLAWLYMTGDYPFVIDHINGVRSDNRYVNLRSSSVLENNRNRGIGSNSSGCLGVSFVKNRWYAYIGVGYKTKHLGSYINIEDAIAARKEAEKMYGFHINHGSRPVFMC